MRDEYTPDTERVRWCYSQYQAGEYAHVARMRKGAEFDRWLAKHDAEVRLRYKMERTGNYK